VAVRTGDIVCNHLGNVRGEGNVSLTSIPVFEWGSLFRTVAETECAVILVEVL
jgi:hypothetical protein